MKKQLFIICAVIGAILLILTAGAVVAEEASHYKPKPVMDPKLLPLFTLKTMKYDPELTIYWCGLMSNSIVLVSEDGSKALIVDTEESDQAKELRKNVKAKEIFIVNTHSHHDHVGGNNLYPEATIIGGPFSKEIWFSEETEGGSARYPDQTIEPNEERVIKIGSETAHIYNTGRSHSQHDVVVYLENRQVLAVGDLVFNGIHPVIKENSFPVPNEKVITDIDAWIKHLDVVLEKYKNIKTVIPGHGKIGDTSIITDLRDYFLEISNAVRDNDEGKLADLKKKYDSRLTVPGKVGFDLTVKFIKSQQNYLRQQTK